MLTEEAGIVLLHASGRESKDQAQHGAGLAKLVIRGAVREMARQCRLAGAPETTQDKDL